MTADFPSTSAHRRIAIIGSGPSGFYAADALQSQSQFPVQIDMFERLPTPHGLVRGGVAPDHAKIKSVTAVYDRIAQKPNFRFFGNVEFGRDITHADLISRYHCIIYTVGAQTDKRLGIDGEDLAGSHAATEFVGWYNGHPDYRDFDFDLTQETAVVIGVGNVAMDVTRILGRTYDELYTTDIADYALEALKNSNVKTIYVLGRRGAAQAAFTNPEIKELGEMTDVNIIVDAANVAMDALSQRELDENPDRAAKRIALKNVEYLTQYATQTPDPAKQKTIIFRFLTSPVEILGTDKVEGVKIVRNELVEDAKGRIRPQATSDVEIIPAGLVFRSVGYRGVALPDVPFREDWGVIPNRDGRVTYFDDGQLGDVVVGEYVAGWIKRGPSGVIGDNRKDAQGTVNLLLADLANDIHLKPIQDDDIADFLTQRDIFYVTYADWLKLDELELLNGKNIGRSRVKFTAVTDMLDALRKLREGTIAE